MLVLKRKAGERLVIPRCDVVVSVLGVTGNTVRLGITAPVTVAVYREEVWERARRKPRVAPPKG
jgi:carbon storage regulator